ncbi:MAG: CAP family transcription factor [uncultured bacterium]|nr:MAG: CAP family transcription factor [uncultured bacterium]
MRRGGVAVYTSQGWVQLGLPMGSHLDAIQMFFKNGGQPGKTPSDKLGHYMPLHYVPVKGYTTFTTGYHAVDFTRYPYFWPLLQQAGFNFYLPTPGDAGKVSAFLKEAFQGRNPQKLTDSVRDEHASNEEGIPDLGTETQRFANKASEDFSRVTHFENDEITIGDGSVVVKQAQEKGPMAYEIYDRGHLLRTIDLGKPEFAPPVENLDVDPRTMFDPKFQEIRKRVLIDGEAGLWPISTADYFSGEGTSGFMLWKDGKVTLIDPPAQTVAYLIQNGIPLNAVEGIAITHDHTDHFTPASIELMFLCPKLNWYGTKTLYNICQDAYTLSIAVNGKPEGLTQLNFVELKPRQFVAVRGMWLRTHYTCHSVAAEAIEVWTAPADTGGQLALYISGDTLADSAELDRLFPDMHPARKAEILRYQHLLESTWDQPNPPMILIEAGMKGLHTDPEVTLAWLKTFAEKKGVELHEVLNRVKFYHVSDGRAAQVGVPKLLAGHQGFISLANHFPKQPETEDSIQERNLRFIEWSPLLAGLSTEQKQALAAATTLATFDIGAVLMLQDEATAGSDATDTSVRMIVSGGFRLYADGSELTHVPFGIIGEGALFGEPRNASAVASMPSQVLTFSAKTLTEVLGQHTETLRHVRELRKKYYRLLKQALPDISDAILTALLMIASEETMFAGNRFIAEGDHTNKDAFLIVDGLAEIWSYAPHDRRITVGPGTVVGEMASINHQARKANVSAQGHVTVLRFSEADLKDMMEKYPIIRTYLQRLAHQRIMDENRLPRTAA